MMTSSQREHADNMDSAFEIEIKLVMNLSDDLFSSSVPSFFYAILMTGP